MRTAENKGRKLLEKARRMMGGLPPHAQVAALPWRKNALGDIEVMLVTSSNGRWILPKGWQEGQEQLHEAAAREAREEAGIEGQIADHSAGIYSYRKKSPSGFYLDCHITVFPLEVTSTAKKWPEKKKRERQWFSTEAAAEQIEHPELAEIVRNFPRLFCA